MGLWDSFKQALGLQAPPASPQEEAAARRDAEAAARQTETLARQAQRQEAAQAIPGWPGPATDDLEAAAAAEQAMATAHQEGFDQATWESDAFQEQLALLEERGALEDLTEVLRRASLRLKHHAPLMVLQARIYTQRYDNQSAKLIWQRLLEAGHHEAEANFRLGELAEREGQPQEAAAYYQRVLALDFHYPNAWQRAEALKQHLPMPRKRAAATVGGAQSAQGDTLSIRAPEGYRLEHPLGRGSYGKSD